MADNVQGTTPVHKANRFAELLAEVENIARVMEPAVFALIPQRYQPYVGVAQALLNVAENPESGNTIDDAATASGDTPQAVIESHGAATIELLNKGPLPDAPADGGAVVVNTGGALVGDAKAQAKKNKNG